MRPQRRSITPSSGHALTKVTYQAETRTLEPDGHSDETHHLLLKQSLVTDSPGQIGKCS